MNIDIYATPKRYTFIAVPSGTAPPTAASRLFKTVWMQRSKPRIYLDCDQVMLAIEKEGVAVISLSGA
jgi:hypothetical protein